jgi:hypothetical protein
MSGPDVFSWVEGVAMEPRFRFMIVGNDEMFASSSRRRPGSGFVSDPNQGLDSGLRRNDEGRIPPE